MFVKKNSWRRKLGFWLISDLHKGQIRRIIVSVTVNVFSLRIRITAGLPGTAGTKSELIRVDTHVIDKIVTLWTGRAVYAFKTKPFVCCYCRRCFYFILTVIVWDHCWKNNFEVLHFTLYFNSTTTTTTTWGNCSPKLLFRFRLYTQNT